MKISPTGVWLNAGTHHHRFDAGLAAAIVEYLQARGGDVLDAGCGDGAYVRALRAAGILCDGYDGNPNTPALTGDICGVLDFALPVHLLASYSWILCLEVGEHIPPELEPVFIHNLHIHNSRGVILSWAVPGQGGVGHFNERDNEYVKGAFGRLGYTNNLQAESEMRAAVTDTCFWFRDTLMVFEREQWTSVRTLP